MGQERGTFFASLGREQGAGLVHLSALPVREGKDREAALSESDSFINEVTEEVRRDRLFAMFRKFGWIGGVIILGIVGGTGWTEWQAARQASKAQAFGDSLLDALDLGAPEDRLAAIKLAPASGDQTAIVGLLLASDPTSDRAEALKALTALGGDASQPDLYRDLANLRLVLLSGSEMPIAERRGLLEAMSGAGRPLRSMALEQLAYLMVEEGKKDEAIVALIALLTDQDATPAMKDRLRQVITALGGTVPEPAAS